MGEYSAQALSSTLATVLILVTAGNHTGVTAHGLSGTPKPTGKPNPDSVNATPNAIATCDATNVTIVMDAAAGFDIIFSVGVML